MADSVGLLRLLEPIVRPDGRAGAAVRSPATLDQSCPFDALLAQARDRVTPTQDAPAEPPPMASLHHIENASLRGLIGKLSLAASAPSLPVEP